MKYFFHKNTPALFHHASMIVGTHQRRRVHLYLYIQSSIDADLQRFFKEYFVDTDLDDDDVEFESFTPEDIRGLPVDLINSCRNRPIASESAT